MLIVPPATFARPSALLHNGDADLIRINQMKGLLFMGKATSPRAAGNKASAKVTAKPTPSAFAVAIASAAEAGYCIADGYSAVIRLIKVIIKASKDADALSPVASKALQDMAMRYKAGHIVRYLMDTPAYAKRVGNYDREQMFADAVEIYAKPQASTGKPNRRTAVEQSACKAATESWRVARNRAFGVVRSRSPKLTTANVETAPPVDMVMASPKLANDNEARDYFRNAFAALVQTAAVNLQTGATKEAKHVAFLVQSIITDAKAAVDKALA